MNLLERLRQYNDSIKAQLNPFDQGEDYRSRINRFNKSNEAEQKQRIPLGEIPKPGNRPYYDEDGTIQNMPVGSSIFRDVGLIDNGTYFDPTGHAGGNNRRYTNSNYLRIAPYFGEHKEFLPMRYRDSSGNIDKIKSLLGN